MSKCRYDLSADCNNRDCLACVLDKIRAEVTAIAINGQVDDHTLFIRTGEQVKQMVLEIIDKYMTEWSDKE